MYPFTYGELVPVTHIKTGSEFYSSIQFRVGISILVKNVVTNLVVGQEGGQRVDQEASLEELGVDPVVEAQSWVDLASVEALAVPLAHQEGVDADRP